MTETVEAMTHAREDWSEQGWRFRLYLTSPTSKAVFDAPEVLRPVDIHLIARWIARRKMKAAKLSSVLS